MKNNSGTFCFCLKYINPSITASIIALKCKANNYIPEVEHKQIENRWLVNEKKQVLKREKQIDAGPANPFFPGCVMITALNLFSFPWPKRPRES